MGLIESFLERVGRDFVGVDVLGQVLFNFLFEGLFEFFVNFLFNFGVGFLYFGMIWLVFFLLHFGLQDIGDHVTFNSGLEFLALDTDVTLMTTYVANYV